MALLLLRNLRAAREDAAAIAEILREVEELILRVDGPSWISCILHVVDIDADEAEALVARSVQSAKESAVTAADQLLQRGRQLGLVEGRQEGLVEGEAGALRRVLRRLATARFGTLGADANRRIQDADVARLERWVDAVLTAPSLEALLSIG